MELTSGLLRAIDTAARLHFGQKRKNGVPFIVHPFSVALILSQHTNDEEVVTAGLLHDVLEDVPTYSFEELEKDFGEKVARIVKTVSNNRNDDWKTNRENYLKRLAETEKEALMVCAADKIHNFLSTVELIKTEGHEAWKKFHTSKELKFWFYDEIQKILRRKLKGKLAEEFDEAYGKLKTVCLE